MFYDLKGKKLRDYNLVQSNTLRKITPDMKKSELKKLVNKDKKNEGVMYTNSGINNVDIMLLVAVLSNMGYAMKFHTGGNIAILIEDQLYVIIIGNSSILDEHTLEHLSDSYVLSEVTDVHRYAEIQNNMFQSMKAAEDDRIALNEMIIKPEWFSKAEGTKLFPYVIARGKSINWLSNNGCRIKIDVISKHCSITNSSGNTIHLTLGRLTQKYMTALLHRDYATVIGMVEKQLQKEGSL